MARPTDASLPYTCAVSTWRYPASNAQPTAFSVGSPSGIVHTPSPSSGISTPLESDTDGRRDSTALTRHRMPRPSGSGNVACFGNGRTRPRIAYERDHSGGGDLHRDAVDGGVAGGHVDE